MGEGMLPGKGFSSGLFVASFSFVCGVSDQLDVKVLAVASMEHAYLPACNLQ